MSQLSIAPEIAAYYRGKDEASRLLTSADGRLELIRTQEILRRHLPETPCDILDVGGATGIHSAWLTGDGHRCTVLDPMPHHVEAARQVGLTAVVGDGRALPFADATFDAVLIMGPLYHLPDPAHRALALTEAARVVRPGGHVAVAAIGRFASLWENSGLGILSKPRVSQIVADIMATGELLTAPGSAFTTAFFHTPDLLTDELAAAGFTSIEIVSVEGPAWGQLKAVEARGIHISDQDDTLFASVLEAARIAERHPELLATASHMLAVARLDG